MIDTLTPNLCREMRSFKPCLNEHKSVKLLPPPPPKKRKKRKKTFKVDRKMPTTILCHYSVTHTSFHIISWSSGFSQKPFPPKQSLENAQQKKKKKKQRKQEGEKAKGKNLGGQCQNVPKKCAFCAFQKSRSFSIRNRQQHNTQHMLTTIYYIVVNL